MSKCDQATSSRVTQIVYGLKNHKVTLKGAPIWSAVTCHRFGLGRAGSASERLESIKAATGRSRP
ncbi:MAG TPA: hypothetical protein VGO73_09395, partial [Pyrinomonadaceae bacterium]|nr:hypothetical protein [Pyrinomonadaceae bacterium]